MVLARSQGGDGAGGPAGVSAASRQDDIDTTITLEILIGSFILWHVKGSEHYRVYSEIIGELASFKLRRNQMGRSG